MSDELEVAPGLLIAMPQLLDPNFHRSVVLMVEHNGEGSFGLVLNQETDARVEQILSSISVEWNGDENATALLGGPVQPETGWLLHEAVPNMQEKESTHEIVPGLFLSSAPEILRALAESPPDRMHFVLGYSGWGPAQLEAELAQGSWVNSDVNADFIFNTPPGEMWEAALRRIGVPPETLAPASGVH